MPLNFTKMHGIGNDILIIDTENQNINITKAFIQQLASRHYGIGFDQLLLVSPPSSEQSFYSTIIYNADGSQAEQCGNGLRCLARYLYETKPAINKEFIISGPTSNHEVIIINNNIVKVNLGSPNFESETLGYPKKNELYRITISENQIIDLGLVAIGNPHAVINCDKLTNETIQQIGPQICKHSQFPNGINVGFMQIISPQEIKLRVYERGVGETLACGSGACAAMIIGRRFFHLEKNVKVNLPGGSLNIEWSNQKNTIWMSGPANYCFSGVWNPK